jgi:hypothetical protein
VRELSPALNAEALSKQRMKLIVNPYELGSTGIMFLARVLSRDHIASDPGRSGSGESAGRSAGCAGSLHVAVVPLLRRQRPGGDSTAGTVRAGDADRLYRVCEATALSRKAGGMARLDPGVVARVPRGDQFGWLESDRESRAGRAHEGGYSFRGTARMKRSRIVAIGHVKGGVGQTTLAVNLAISNAIQEKDVLLVDGDEQGTARLI